MSRTQALAALSLAIEQAPPAVAFQHLADRWLGRPAPPWTEAVPLVGPDPLTPLYAAWLHQHARETRQRTGTWYTPPALAQAVVGQVPMAHSAPHVLDPAVGTGEFLLAAGARWPAARLEGWDCDATALVISQARLARAGLTATLHLRDSLAAPLAGPVDVIVGNPPWWRVTAGAGGGFVTAGHPDVAGGRPLFDDLRAGVPGRQTKNAHNQYVYFARLCLWQAFEQHTGPAAVALVTPASLLDGPAFAGLRTLLRRADSLEVVALGGDGRAGAGASPLGVRTPACVVVATRGMGGGRRWAHDLDFSFNFSTLAWMPLARDGALGPVEVRRGWPLDAVFPWVRSGVKLGRTWPIGPDKATLARRWRTLLAAEGEARRALFKPSPTGRTGEVVLALPADAPCPPIVPYAWRTFDRQWLLLDFGLLDRPAEPLWAAHGPGQRYLTTGRSAQGPAATLSAEVPDLHHFSGRGARDVIPWWRADGRPNVDPVVATRVAQAHGAAPEDVFWYAAAVWAQPGHGARLGPALSLPLTASTPLFEAGVALGRRLDATPPGRARCVVPVHHPAMPVLHGDVVHVGDGRLVEISREVMDFRAGSLPVVRHFVSHRLGGGRTSSALDDHPPWTPTTTAALLETLWKIEHLLALGPELSAWLDAVLAGPELEVARGQSLR